MIRFVAAANSKASGCCDAVHRTGGCTLGSAAPAAQASPSRGVRSLSVPLSQPLSEPRWPEDSDASPPRPEPGSRPRHPFLVTLRAAVRAVRGPHAPWLPARRFSGPRAGAAVSSAADVTRAGGEGRGRLRLRPCRRPVKTVKCGQIIVSCCVCLASRRRVGPGGALPPSSAAGCPQLRGRRPAACALAASARARGPRARPSHHSPTRSGAAAVKTCPCGLAGPGASGG